jgi:hypothetical protein
VLAVSRNAAYLSSFFGVLPPGCPPGLLASFSLAWRDYPPDRISSSLSFFSLASLSGSNTPLHPRTIPTSCNTFLFSFLPDTPVSTRYPLPFRTVFFLLPFRRRRPNFLRERKPLCDQSQRVFRSVRQSGPSQRFPQGGCWPNFPTHSPGGASHPRGCLPVRSFPPRGKGGAVESLHFSPLPTGSAIHGGADMTRGARERQAAARHIDDKL